MAAFQLPFETGSHPSSREIEVPQIPGQGKNAYQTCGLLQREFDSFIKAIYDGHKFWED